ncbi:MAG: hypothetical protein ACR2OZ_18065 [Verrucomicrobiales bacterium]
MNSRRLWQFAARAAPVVQTVTDIRKSSVFTWKGPKLPARQSVV